jgi:hypothetical protein
MPHYHFNVINGSKCIDDLGVDLPDLPAAMAMADLEAGQLFRDGRHDLWYDSEWQLEVTDGLGLILFTLMFSRHNASAVNRVG